MDRIILGDNLDILRTLPDGSVSLIYIDPPFNTGRTRTRQTIKTARAPDGDRIGFGGRNYRTSIQGEQSYADKFDDYLGFLGPRLAEARRILAPDGSLYFHIGWKESAYCRVLLDRIFGRDSLINAIVWSYDYGARSKSRWPAKHDEILWYAKNPENFIFNYADLDRIPYLAPDLVGPEKAARGKTPTDVWWHTIVPTNGKEKTGYPTQKPLGIVRRIVRASSRPGDTVLDFFAGSGTLGQAALELGREFILIDNNPQAIETMKRRFAARRNIEWLSG